MTINFHSVMEKLSRVLPGTKLIQAMRAYNSTVAGVVAQGRQVMAQVVTAYNGVVQGEIVNGTFIDATPAGMDGTINSAIMTAKDNLSLSATRMQSLIEAGRDEVVPFSVTPPSPSDMFPSDSSVPVAIRGCYKGCFVDSDNNLWLNTEHMAAAILRDLTAQWVTTPMRLFNIDPLGMSKVATVPTVGTCYVHWVSPTVCLAIHSLTINAGAAPVASEENQYYDMYLLDASRSVGAKIGSIRFRFSLSNQPPILSAVAVLVTGAPSGWFKVEPYLGPTFSFSGLQRFNGGTTGDSGWMYYSANVSSGFDIGGSIANVGGDVTISDALMTMFGDPTVVDDLIASLDTILSE